MQINNCVFELELGYVLVMFYRKRTLKTVTNAQRCILLTKQQLYKFTCKNTSKGPWIFGTARLLRRKI